MARAKRRRNGSSSLTIKRRFVSGTLADDRSAASDSCILNVLEIPALTGRRGILAQNARRSQSQRRSRPDDRDRRPLQRPVQAVDEGDFGPRPLQQGLGDEDAEAQMLML